MVYSRFFSVRDWLGCGSDLDCFWPLHNRLMIRFSSSTSSPVITATGLVEATSSLEAGGEPPLLY
jgi:hypothetical protein